MMYDSIYSKTTRLEHPQHKSSWLSNLTFWYTIPIFRKGSRRELTEDDLTNPLNDHKSSILGEKLALRWSQEQRRAKEYHHVPNLTKVLYGMFLKEIILQGLYQFLIEIPVRFFQPLFLGLLIRYFSLQNQNSTEPTKDPTYLMRIFAFWSEQSPIQFEEAVVFATGVLLCSLITFLVLHPCSMSSVHTGMKMRIACCSLIYRKTLRLNLTFLSGDFVGNVVNLLSNDVNRFDTVLLCFHYLWIGPLQILLALLMLYQEVGISAAFGLSIMEVVIPLQAWLGNRTSRFRLISAYRTDERVRQMNEIIQGMQVIKMYTWEYAFAKQIDELRSSEIKAIKAIAFVKGLSMSFLLFTTRVALFVTVVSVLLGGNEITAEKMFIVSSFYQILRQSMNSQFPYAIAAVAEAHVSIARIKRLLMLEECQVGDPRVMDPGAEPPKPRTSDDPKVNLSNVSVVIDTEVCLNNVTLRVDQPQLIAVIGQVGAGKSSLLNVILREVRPWTGSCEIMGTVSYASQEPWLFAGTVRQNILFGRKYDKQRYWEVVDMCALETDFQLLPSRDYTQIGEKGVTLSGGQRARINLARAVYKAADIYLLDDPLSAVDTNVAKHLFEKCIRGYLRDKIVVLVTHQLQFLSNVDRVIIMDQGTILGEETYETLESTEIDFAEFVQTQLGTNTEEDEIPRSPSTATFQDIVKDLQYVSTFSLSVINKEGQPFKPVKTDLARQRSAGFSIFKCYLKAGSGFCFNFCVVLLFMISEFFASGNDFFLAELIEVEELRAGGYNDTGLLLSPLDRNTCLIIFSVITIALVVITLIRSYYFVILCMTASVNLHERMFQSVITASMRFFATNTSGQILNRFSRDLGAIDDFLPTVMLDCYQIMMTLLGSATIVMIVNKYLAVPTVIMCCFFYLLRSCYIKTSKTTKRLESTCRSPVYAHLNATIQGLATVRSNSAELLLTEEFDKLQDDHSSAWFMFIATLRAFGYCIDLICVMYIGIITFSFLIFSASGSRVGLAIVTTIGLTGLFQWGIKQSAETENQLVSVERVVEYIEIEHEPNLKSKPDTKPPPEWPSQGQIEWKDLTMRYRMGDPPVLKSLNLVIHPQEKIGIVGRTGAGKSSMIATMFRLAYFEGTILIDGIDTSTIGLHDLRRKISIIPQEPVLFSGTLRYNMDPFNHYDDDSILDALMVVQNKIVLAEGMESLDHHVSEGGVNVSVGERQLICLARAILRNNRILVLDEATANIDPKTDKFIQTTIRRSFRQCTVLTIAHRLHTIMDYDRVLVIDAGNAVEFDHPYILLQKRMGHLTTLVQKTGPTMAKNLKEIAQQNYKLKHGQS